MPKRLVLADLDRTLFDTARFVHDVWAFVALQYGIDAEAQRQLAPNFFHYYGDWYDYQFFDHLSKAVGGRFDQPSFIALARKEMGPNYLYDDVTSEVIESIDAIVTFGNEAYQSFKLLLCPQLDGIERHIILGSKGEYIAKTFREPTVLIDDKQIGDEIRPPAAFIRIDRTAVVQPGAPDEMVINSFWQLPEMLRTLKLNDRNLD